MGPLPWSSPCHFHSSPDWTNQTLALDRAIRVLILAIVFLLHTWQTGEVSVGPNLQPQASDATKSYTLDLLNFGGFNANMTNALVVSDFYAQ